MSIRRTSLWHAIGTMTLVGILTVAMTGCSAAESRDDPDDTPLAAAEDGDSTTDPVTAADEGVPDERSSRGVERDEPARPAVERRSDPAPGPEPERIRRDVAPDPDPVVSIPSGTRMTFRLEESISTKSSRNGDVFRATLTHDVASPDHAFFIPAGSAAWGTVVESQESQSSDVPAVLAVRLQSVAVSGVTHSFDATIVEADASTQTRDSGGETAAKVAVGAAAGALLGRIVGKNTEGALIGAGAGAAAGTVYAIQTKGGHAEMDRGALITVELDEPLVVR